MQRARTAVQAYTMINSAVRREFDLELGRRGSLSEAGRLTNLLQFTQHFAAERPILRLKIQIRYGFHFSWFKLPAISLKTKSNRYRQRNEAA